jgi:isopropylmalate/homocitrate/citramalate synthase
MCTDLRDGNQALENPMGIEQKIAYFKILATYIRSIQK